MAVALVTAAYGLGNVVGRASESALVSAPIVAVGTPSETTAAADDPAAAEDPGAADDPGAAEADGVTAPPEGVDAGVGGAQAATSIVRPLLHLPGSGPAGTHRTTGASYVALTFDDGPDPHWTPEVLELLRDHDVKATFCVVGRNVEAYPDLVRAIAADGHTLCNHSWGHDMLLGSRSRAHIREDLGRTNSAIRKVVPDATISYYRQPGGEWTPRVVSVAEEMGMASLHWAVDPQDWREPGAGAIASGVTAAVQPGAIVLLHDGGGPRGGTVQALTTLLPELTRWLGLDALPLGLDPHALPQDPSRLRWH